jgi:hypothetical protein
MSLKSRDVAGKIARAPRGVARAFRNFKDVVEIVPKGKTILAFSVITATVAATMISRKLKKAINMKRFLAKRDSHFLVDGRLEQDGV